MVTERLSRIDWLNAALKSLAKQGHESLRAERLAKQLGVSRGSFYWHFSDVETFEQAVLEQWERLAVDIPYAKASTFDNLNSSTALKSLIQSALQAPIALDRAMRSWATVSQKAGLALERVDDRRLSLLTTLISSTEACPDQANARAVILYWAYLGHVMTAGKMVDDVVIAALIDQFCDT